MCPGDTTKNRRMMSLPTPPKTRRSVAPTVATALPEIAEHRLTAQSTRLAPTFCLVRPRRRREKPSSFHDACAAERADPIFGGESEQGDEKTGREEENMVELSTSLPPQTPAASTDGGRSAASPGLAAQLSGKVRRGRSSKDVLPEHVVVPESVFALAEQPSCALEGHQDDVLDLSWSKSQQLLSSSMDHTVRLWDVVTKTCLRVFPHSDYVTCVQFNPVDDGYFISGSLDCKVRIWSVPDRQVVDWSDLNDMVTAACYTPDGQAAIIGSHKGSCRFYKTTDCKLNPEAQIDMSITKKRRSQAKKITGFHFAPGNPSEILVTTADSQIRVFNGISVLQKFKGFKNTSSQISASYTADGRYVVCASEDSTSTCGAVSRQRASGVGGGGTGGSGSISVRAKTWLTSRSSRVLLLQGRVRRRAVARSPSSFRPRRASPGGNGNGKSDTPRKQQSSSRRDDVVGGAGGGVPRVTKSGPMTKDNLSSSRGDELMYRLIYKKIF
ncbi:unnamed protein product [Miscanthus lutarioriparius]|uniref:Uncharacterized protein n=1 Tax=Miscanthus lutarioriparius TaxID=422564 RepID=A0A811QNT9_9POAL|nr:unnamed protein product [Miscanthus lutarioriparius]